jgi:hypothetical protein
MKEEKTMNTFRLKPTAYLIVIAWLATLAGLSWAMLAATTESRTEFSRLIFAPAEEPAVLAEAVLSAPSWSGEVPTDLRSRLTDALGSLTASLESYQISLANGATAPPAAQTTTN